jgi:O-antigen ligase
VSLVLLVDGACGFPLVARFGHEGATGRLEVWHTAWALFRDAPVVGQGPHTFLYTDALTGGTMPWVHNLYLEVLAEQGLLGLASLGGLLAAGGTAAWRSVRAGDKDTRILGGGVLAGILGFGLSAFVELSFIRQWVVVMLFTLVGMAAHLSRSKPCIGE